MVTLTTSMNLTFAQYLIIPSRTEGGTSKRSLPMVDLGQGLPRDDPCFHITREFSKTPLQGTTGKVLKNVRTIPVVFQFF